MLLSRFCSKFRVGITTGQNNGSQQINSQLYLKKNSAKTVVCTISIMCTGNINIFLTNQQRVRDILYTCCYGKTYVLQHSSNCNLNHLIKMEGGRGSKGHIIHRN